MIFILLVVVIPRVMMVFVVMILIMVVIPRVMMLIIPPISILLIAMVVAAPTTDFLEKCFGSAVALFRISKLDNIVIHQPLQIVAGRCVFLDNVLKILNIVTNVASFFPVKEGRAA